MVDMTHHRYNRSAVHEIVLVILLFGNGVLYLSTDILGGESELLSYDIDGFSIQTLVDTYHDTDAHTGTDDLIDADVHHRCQLGYRHKLRQFQHLALCCLCCHLLTDTLLDGIALLTTVLGTLFVLVL